MCDPCCYYRTKSGIAQDDLAVVICRRVSLKESLYIGINIFSDMGYPEHELTGKDLGNLSSFLIRTSRIFGLLIQRYCNLLFEIIDDILCQNRKSAVKVIEFIVLLANVSGEDHLEYLRQNIIDRILIGLVRYIGLIDYPVFLIIRQNSGYNILEFEIMIILFHICSPLC